MKKLMQMALAAVGATALLIPAAAGAGGSNPQTSITVVDLIDVSGTTYMFGYIGSESPSKCEENRKVEFLTAPTAGSFTLLDTGRTGSSGTWAVASASLSIQNELKVKVLRKKVGNTTCKPVSAEVLP